MTKAGERGAAHGILCNAIAPVRLHRIDLQCPPSMRGIRQMSAPLARALEARIRRAARRLPRERFLHGQRRDLSLSAPARPASSPPLTHWHGSARRTAGIGLRYLGLSTDWRVRDLAIRAPGGRNTAHRRADCGRETLTTPTPTSSFPRKRNPSPFLRPQKPPPSSK